MVARSVAMADSSKPSHHGEGSRNPIPRWDSSPQTYQRYQEEIRVFKLAEDMDQKYSVAARLVSALSGPARQVGLVLTDYELFPRTDTVDTSSKALTNEERNRRSVDNLVKQLGTILQPQKSTERSTRLEDFFGSKKHYRKKGMRIAEYTILFEEHVERLREVEINPDGWGDLLGWLYLRGAGLSQERHERVLCSLPKGDEFPLQDFKEMLPRYFPDIHRGERADPLPTRQGHGGASSSSFRYSSMRDDHG